MSISYKKLTKKTIPGILMCVVIAAIATMLAKVKIGSVSFEVVGAPVFAIIIGMVVTLIKPTLSGGDSLQPGIKFTSKKILQWALQSLPQ